MFSTRDFSQDEIDQFGLHGKIHDNSDVPFGERVGVVLVHGRAGNENLMWVFSKTIESHDPIVIAPRAILPDPIGGYSWWNVGRQVSFEEVESTTRYIKKLVLGMPGRYGVDPRKIIIIGFSQGGAVAISLALLNPSLFLGVGMLASFIPRALMDKSQIDYKIPLNVFISHGSNDDVITLDRAILGYEFLKIIGTNVKFSQDEATHKISSGSLKLFKNWISELLQNESK